MEPSSPDPVTSPPVGVLDRGLLLLHQFTMDRNRLHLRDLAELSQLDKATTLRALRSLVQWGFLERHSDGSYSPGPMNLRLAAIYKVTSSLVVRIARPLDAIAEMTGQSAAFFVRSDRNRVCLGRSRKRAAYGYFVEVGTSVPLDHGGSAARVLMAHTAPPADEDALAVHAKGHAISRGERLRHFASISLPVFEMDGVFLGVITIAGPAEGLSDVDLVSHADTAREELHRAGYMTDAPLTRP